MDAALGVTFLDWRWPQISLASEMNYLLLALGGALIYHSLGQNLRGLEFARHL